MTEFNVGDKVDVYEEKTRIFKDLIIENIDDTEVSFLDKDFTCHVDDLRFSNYVKPEPAPTIVTDYQIIREKRINNFETKCANALNEGWTPIGGVAFSSTDDSLIQAFAISRDVVPNHKPNEFKG